MYSKKSTHSQSVYSNSEVVTCFATFSQLSIDESRQVPIIKSQTLYQPLYYKPVKPPAVALSQC